MTVGELMEILDQFHPKQQVVLKFLSDGRPKINYSDNIEIGTTEGSFKSSYGPIVTIGEI